MRRKQKLSAKLRAGIKSIQVRLRTLFRTKRQIRDFNTRVAIARAYKRLFSGIQGAKTWKDLKKMGFGKHVIQY